MGAVGLGDLRRIRKALGRSQRELADLLGVSTRAVQSYEQGWRAVPQHVQKLAGLLLYLWWRKRGGRPAPCWKVSGCDPRTRARCRATELGAEDCCWLVTGLSCRGRRHRSWRGKLAECARCPVVRPWLASGAR